MSVVYTPGNAFDLIKNFVGPLIGPLGTAALVIVFVIFILLELEDLRDRVIHLIGHGHLQVTTQALDKAGRRVSRYLLAQLMRERHLRDSDWNGTIFHRDSKCGALGPARDGAALYPLHRAVDRGGVSDCALPGRLSGVDFAVAHHRAFRGPRVDQQQCRGAMAVRCQHRPFAGGGDCLRCILDVALGPGRPVASTPLTVCIAVLGKYIPSLSFLDVLLGDRPPIAPEDRFYQRLLAQDAEEICEIAENHTEKHSLEETFEHVIIPALRLCEEDFRKGIVSESNRSEMHRLVRDLVLDVGPGADPR